uniref:Uncharacterized protein n=1 Tax=Parascaris univalens TaxID=6257 RepID=A0A915AKK2_PARUN
MEPVAHVRIACHQRVAYCYLLIAECRDRALGWHIIKVQDGSGSVWSTGADANRARSERRVPLVGSSFGERTWHTWWFHCDFLRGAWFPFVFGHLYHRRFVTVSIWVVDNSVGGTILLYVHRLYRKNSRLLRIAKALAKGFNLLCNGRNTDSYVPRVEHYSWRRYDICIGHRLWLYGTWQEGGPLIDEWCCNRSSLECECQPTDARLIWKPVNGVISAVPW